VVELSNRGEDEHNLHLRRLPGGPEYAVDTTAPLSYNRVRLETMAGSYRLWCSLPGHAERGMDTTVEVTGRSPTRPAGGIRPARTSPG
jgi:hypothetical protein